VLACALVAQILTVAALGRAAYLGFYRRRTHEYEHLESTRPGMRISLGLLSVGCVAFGALAGPFVQRIAGPAAAGLLDPERYAAAALGGSVAFADSHMRFEYLHMSMILTIAAELILGTAVLALTVQERGVQRIVAWLRRVHTGSINDYAAFAAVGMIVVVSTVLKR
jgi:multicomponent Na+:H+ antiporter subunit D